MARFFLSRDMMRPETGEISIFGGDAHHIAYSLRMAVGDMVIVCDMQMTEYHCTISAIRPDEVRLHIDRIESNDTELPVRIHIYQSLPKGDKMEYIIQKAVELGAASLTPVMSRRCIVKLDDKGVAKKLTRWQKIAEEAAKQCGRGYIPEIRQPRSFEDAIKEGAAMDVPLFCYEGDGTVSLKSVLENVKSSAPVNGMEQLSSAVFIGPEGGYDIKEVHLAQSAGITCVNLGKRILRCETASGFVLSAMTYVFEL